MPLDDRAIDEKFVKNHLARLTAREHSVVGRCRAEGVEDLWDLGQRGRQEPEDQRTRIQAPQSRG